MKQNLWLSKPDASLQLGFLAMLEAFRALREERYNDIYDDPDFDFPVYVAALDGYSRGEGLPEGWVTTSVFWLTDGSQIIGTGRVRHVLNEELMVDGGNIGYDINPLFRRRGYGTLMLRLLLGEAKKLGMEKALVTCDSDNEGSRRIIEKNGGVYAGESVSPENGKTVLRFWVATAE